MGVLLRFVVLELCRVWRQHALFCCRSQSLDLVILLKFVHMLVLMLVLMLARMLVPGPWYLVARLLLYLLLCLCLVVCSFL